MPLVRHARAPLGAAVRLLAAATLLLAAACRDATAPTPSGVPALGASVLLDEDPGAVVLVGAGEIATCTNDNDEATAKLLDAIAGTVFTAGSNANPTGSATEFADCYAPTWGRHKARTRPAPGPKDYGTAGAAGYFDYFGAAAGTPGEGYYSYDVGVWHVVVLNSEIATTATSAQVQWLRADLAASPLSCTLAIWGFPRFFSTGTTGVRPAVKPLWDALYAYGAELVVNANFRFYERFAPQNPDEGADPAYGIRQITVGTGGAGSNSFGTVRPNSEVRSSGTAGVLRLVLGDGAYEWAFVPVAGKSFTDAGTGLCHESPPPVADPGGPYTSEAAVAFDGSRSGDPQGDLPLTYAWDFGDGTSDTGVAPSHLYAADGDYTVSLVVTDALGNASAPATTTVTIANLAPTIVTTGDIVAATGQPVTVRAYLADPGPDAPWSFVVRWGDGAESPGSLASQSLPIVATHGYAATGDYPVQIEVTDHDGATGTAAITVHVVADAPPQSEVLLGAGDIASCVNANDEATATLLDGMPGTLFTFGDNAYPNGRARDYADCFGPSWGRHKTRLYATLGNHEYDTGTADASFAYFGDRAGPAGKGYYSLDLGQWHVIVLNDNLDFVPIDVGSEQDQWLAADLAANTKPCTIAIWHQPRFYSSDGGTTLKRKPFWDRLYEAGVELVLNGHQHQYERFAPQTPEGVRDDTYGVREIIVGTGGESIGMPTAYIAPNSEVRGDSYGVIRLVLSPGHYEWQFVPVAGQTFSDAGSGDCHGPPPPAPVDVSVSSSLPVATWGDAVTLTAQVAIGALPVTAGAVTFIEGGSCASPAEVLAGPKPLGSSGRATFTTSTLSAAGSPHSITACYGGGGRFLPGSAVVAQVVKPVPQTLDFPALAAERTFGDANFQIAATASSGLPVVFATTSPTCAVSATSLQGATSVATVRLTGPGVGTGGCTITASQPGDGNRTAAAPVSRAFDVLARIDAMPGRADNRLMWKQAVDQLSISILTMRSADGSVLFDAAAVNPSSLTLTGTRGAVAPATDKKGIRAFLKDLDLDGDLDLQVFFDGTKVFGTTDVGFTRTVVLRGSLKAPSSRPIRGTDVVAIAK